MSRKRGRIRNWGTKRPTAPTTRVAIAIPAGDMMHTETAISLAQLIQHTVLAQPPGLESLVLNSYSSSILPYSRQLLAEAAVEAGATHLLTIDSDMGFPRDMLVHLLGHASRPIVGINATARRPPHRNCAQYEGTVEVETFRDSKGIEKVHRMGLGIALISTAVFKAIEKPWFDFEWVPELRCFRGEDHSFCAKAQAAGFELVIDQDLSKLVTHMGSFPYNPVAKSLARAAKEKMQ